VAMRGFLYGPLGGTIAGRWIALAFIFHIPFRRKERWAFVAAGLSLGTWLLVDSAVSFATGAWLNVVMINLAPSLLVLVPMLLGWRSMRNA